MPWGFYFGFNFLVNLFCDLRKYPPSAFVRKMALDSYLHFIPSGFNPFYQFFFFFFFTLSEKKEGPFMSKALMGQELLGATKWAPTEYPHFRRSQIAFTTGILN